MARTGSGNTGMSNDIYILVASSSSVLSSVIFAYSCGTRGENPLIAVAASCFICIVVAAIMGALKGLVVDDR